MKQQLQQQQQTFAFGSAYAPQQVRFSKVSAFVHFLRKATTESNF
jgi:hypothetical protein